MNALNIADVVKLPLACGCIFIMALLLLLSGGSSPAYADVQLTTNSPPPIISIWGGAREAIDLKQDGTVWTWGNNPAGELGNGSLTYEALPTQVVGPNGVGTLNSIAAIMGSEAHNLALASDGTVWALGPCLRGSL